MSLVGAGPGDRGLLTVRGRERLLAADAIVCDRLAVTTLPCDLPASVELHWVGKEAGHHPVPQDEINALLVRLAREGKRVVRLKGGDPYVFGRGGEEALALSEAGVAFEVIPGVTAGVAVAAYAGVPVTHRHEAARVTFVTAHEAIRSSRCSVRWDLLAADPHATLVGYMGVTSLPDVVERLLAAGMDPATPAAMVERGTTSRQRVVTCTLSGLVDGVRREHLDAPALFVIGPTVRYASRLDWFSRRPLFGERIVLVAPSGGIGRELERCGADVVEVSLPVTPVSQAVLRALPITGCVARSVDELEALEDERTGPSWGPEVVAWCLGREVARRARERGVRRVEELDPATTPRALARAVVERRPGAKAGQDGGSGTRS